jgi:hypothetical protein
MVDSPKMNSINLSKITIIDAIFIALNVVIIIFLFQKGVMTFGDSQSYITNHIIRTPSYPLWLDFFEFLLGTEDYLLGVVYFQIIISFTSVLFLSLVLKKYFKLGKITFFLIYLILISPVYSPFTYIKQNLVNQIGTDSLTYSLFLLYIGIVTKTVFKLNFKSLIYILFISILIVTIRPQFIFLYLIEVILIFYYGLKSKNIHKTINLVLIFTVFLLSASLYQRTYNYFFHGVFSSIPPLVGTQLLVAQLYLSNPSVP